MPKIVLSRKGFDEKAGGNASVIHGGSMVPFPIPRVESNLFYRDLIFDGRTSLLTVMKDLGINQFSECHLDPDLIHSVLPIRDTDWKPAFGQSGTAESILRNETIGEGDLFLFFGWFKNIDKVGSKFKYRDGVSKGTGFHSLFGYLEIGQRIDLTSLNAAVPACYARHPHVYERNQIHGPNTLYIASDRLSFDHSKPGAGAFRFRGDLKLTRDGCSKSKWNLPFFFNELVGCFNAEITVERTYADSIDLFINGRASQEVFVSSDERAVNWAKEIIRKSEIQN